MSEDAAFILACLVLFILFYGEPDLMSVIIQRLSP